MARSGTALFDLTGRIALVTGAGQGLGLGMSRALASAGAAIVMVGRDEERIEACARSVRDTGATAAARTCDLLEPDAVTALVDGTIAEFGRIDILVNNAGIQSRGALVDVPDADWDRMLATHMSAPFRLSKAIAPSMIARRSGKIINTVSVLAELGRPMVVPYAAAKGGLRMLTRALAVELAPHNVQVNAIGPGYFVTEMNRDLLGDQAYRQAVDRRVPAGRWGDPDELSGAILYLASEASSYVNGQVLFVDGGLTASF
ncbi:MAG: glucose 1-dehydrogenase [Microvirga sp.]